MGGYEVIKSEIFLNQLKELLNSSNAAVYARAFRELVEAISKDPWSKGGVMFTGQQWVYGLLDYKIRPNINKDKKTVELLEMFRLP